MKSANQILIEETEREAMEIEAELALRTEQHEALIQDALENRKQIQAMQQKEIQRLEEDARYWEARARKAEQEAREDSRYWLKKITAISRAAAKKKTLTEAEILAIIGD